MNSKTLAERLRGGVAAFFLIGALHRITLDLSRLIAAQEFRSVRYSASHGWASLTFCSIQLFLAAWVFLDKKYAVHLATAYVGFLFAFAVTGIFWSFGPTLSYIKPSTSSSNHTEYTILCEYVFLMTGYLFLLLLIVWLRRLEKRSAITIATENNDHDDPAST